MKSNDDTAVKENAAEQRFLKLKRPGQYNDLVKEYFTDSQINMRMRNRINDSIIDHPLKDYWEIFVIKHSKPVNIFIHIIGLIYLYGIIIFGFATKTYWLFLFIPISQILGILGHVFFEPNNHIDLRDAFLSKRATICVHRLFFSVVTGQYQKEVIRVNKKMSEYLRKNGHISLTSVCHQH